VEAREVQHPDGEIRYEGRDVSPGLVAKFGVALVALSIVTAVGGLALFRIFAARAAQRGGAAPPYERTGGRELPPEPRLQTTPYADLERLVAEQQQLLDSYGWVDEESGVVRIRIDRAMELLVERGLPHRPPEGGAEASQ
jgi:hypothetical protein